MDWIGKARNAMAVTAHERTTDRAMQAMRQRGKRGSAPRRILEMVLEIQELLQERISELREMMTYDRGQPPAVLNGMPREGLP
jgi:acyl-CoA reductase-like NAD-dependent aldehyde dehydrogenase